MADKVYLYQRIRSADIRLIAIAISVLVSLIVIAGNPILNDDAFGYIKAADVFADQGLNATLSTYGWFGYSVLISLINSILQVGLINSAHLLNVLSFALLVYAFITLVMEYTASTWAKIFAAVVILCFPTINEMRYTLVRDFAYWAFCLTGLLQLIRFNRSHQLVNGLGWLLAMTAAVFFRLEGLLILALSPFALLMPGQASRKQKRQLFITLLALLLGGFVLILILFLMGGINLIEIFNYTYRWYLPLLVDYPDTITNAASSASFSSHISEQLETFSGKGMIVLFFGYLYSVAATLFMTLSPPVSLFLIFGFITGRQSLAEKSKWPWLFFLLASLLSLFIFVSIMQFLTTRYSVMTALLLLSLIPLCLEDLYRQAQQSGRMKQFRLIVGAAILYFSVDSLISFGYSKTYIQEAIDWSVENISSESMLLTNSFAIAYYSGLVEDYDDINPDTAVFMAELPTRITGQEQERVEFIALDLDHNDSNTLAELDKLEEQSRISELVRFSNSRDDAIIIFKVDTLP